MEKILQKYRSSVGVGEFPDTHFAFAEIENYLREERKKKKPLVISISRDTFKIHILFT